MTITRFALTRDTGPEYMKEDSSGKYARHCDYLKAVESLEYDLRYEREQKEEALGEAKYWRDLYMELYENSY